MRTNIATSQQKWSVDKLFLLEIINLQRPRKIVLNRPPIERREKSLERKKIN